MEAKTRVFKSRMAHRRKETRLRQVEQPISEKEWFHMGALNELSMAT